eukprot:scaffold245550_cov28-Tisochrysis_lutea.AAC.2
MALGAVGATVELGAADGGATGSDGGAARGGAGGGARDEADGAGGVLRRGAADGSKTSPIMRARRFSNSSESATAARCTGVPAGLYRMALDQTRRMSRTKPPALEYWVLDDGGIVGDVEKHRVDRHEEGVGARHDEEGLEQRAALTKGHFHIVRRDRACVGRSAVHRRHRPTGWKGPANGRQGSRLALATWALRATGRGLGVISQPRSGPVEILTVLPDQVDVTAHLRIQVRNHQCRGLMAAGACPRPE